MNAYNTVNSYIRPTIYALVCTGVITGCAIVGGLSSSLKLSPHSQNSLEQAVDNIPITAKQVALGGIGAVVGLGLSSILISLVEYHRSGRRFIG